MNGVVAEDRPSRRESPNSHGEKRRIKRKKEGKEEQEEPEKEVDGERKQKEKIRRQEEK